MTRQGETAIRDQRPIGQVIGRDRPDSPGALRLTHSKRGSNRGRGPKAKNPRHGTKSGTGLVPKRPAASRPSHRGSSTSPATSPRPRHRPPLCQERCPLRETTRPRCPVHHRFHRRQAHRPLRPPLPTRGCSRKRSPCHSTRWAWPNVAASRSPQKREKTWKLPQAWSATSTTTTKRLPRGRLERPSSLEFPSVC